MQINEWIQILGPITPDPLGEVKTVYAAEPSRAEPSRADPMGVNTNKYQY